MRPTYANVMATAAMFVALGGTSYAAVKIAKDSVGTREVKNRSLQREDLAGDVIPSSVRGPRGAQGPSGTPGADGQSNVIVRQRNGQAFVGFGAGDSVDVATMTLPAGTWFVEAETLGVYFPNGGIEADVFRCVLRINGVDNRDTENFMGNKTGASHMADFGLQQLVRVSAGTRVVLACRHDLALPSGASVPDFRHTTLWATQVANADAENVTG